MDTELDLEGWVIVGGQVGFGWGALWGIRGRGPNGMGCLGVVCVFLGKRITVVLWKCV